jgi:hypothetical protein
MPWQRQAASMMKSCVVAVTYRSILLSLPLLLRPGIWQNRAGGKANPLVDAERQVYKPAGIQLALRGRAVWFKSAARKQGGDHLHQGFGKPASRAFANHVIRIQDAGSCIGAFEITAQLDTLVGLSVGRRRGCDLL